MNNSKPKGSFSQTATAEDELKFINQLLYRQNTELVIRNKTLGVLRHIYEIINTTLDVESTAQKLAQAIATQLSFRKVSIALLRDNKSILEAVATFPDELTSLRQLKLPMTDTQNFCVDAVKKNRTRLTNDLYDILVPLLTHKQATKLQELIGINTSIIYPLTFGNTPLGVLVVGLDKNIGALSRTERETLKELINVVAIAIERAQIYIDLQSANEQLKQLDKLKDEFVSIASHELRAPMTAISGFVSMIMDGDYGPAGKAIREPLSEVDKATQRLIHLVSDLLDVSRIEAGRIAYNLTAVDLEPLLGEVIAQMAPLAKSRRILLRTKLRQPDQVQADSDKVKQILINLISNALKFTDKGSITVTMEKADDYVVVSVTDTGIGIERKNQEKLFTKFSQISSQQRGRPAGTGLGLYISRSLAQAMGGNLKLTQSTIQKGSTFSFNLPNVDTIVAKTAKNRLIKLKAVV